MQGAIRGGSLRPKAKQQGLWISVMMASFAALGLYDRKLWEEVRTSVHPSVGKGWVHRDEDDPSTANVTLNAIHFFTPKVTLLFQEDSKWASLLDGNDTLRIAWACRTLKQEYELLMYTLQCQAAKQV